MLKKILCISTAGKGGQDELRMKRLASSLDAEITYYCVDRSVSRMVASQNLWQFLKSSKWDLVYQEGTGIVGGANLILAALLRKQPFVVSSGDPIGGYFRTTKGFMIGSIFEIYEYFLYQMSTGFIGWTPYLTGAALKMGAKRAVTVEGAVDLDIFHQYAQTRRVEIRQKYGIPENHVVCGVVGSLRWSTSQSYCYGYELVETLKHVKREDVSILIVGDGDGKSRLLQLVPETLRSRVIFTGRLPEEEVVDAINAMNIGFVTQSGELGRYRLSTKLPEYLACGVPVAMSPIAGFYDYTAAAGWALPDLHPASSEFHQRCAQWIDHLSWKDIAEKSEQSREIAHRYFDYAIVTEKFRTFIHSLLESVDYLEV